MCKRQHDWRIFPENYAAWKYVTFRRFKPWPFFYNVKVFASIMNRNEVPWEFIITRASHTH